MKESESTNPPLEPGYYCYIVECGDGSYYTGWAKDPYHRCTVHNTGKGAKYTRMHAPVKLVYFERLESIQAVMKRERAVKKLTRLAKIKLIEQFNLP